MTVQSTVKVGQASLDKSLGHDEIQWGTSGHLAVYIMCMSFFDAMTSVKNERNSCI